MTLIYSKNIVEKLREIALLAKNILQFEMGLSFRGRRFVYKNYLYPVHIVCFTHETRLGYFDPELYEIGVHRDILLDQSTLEDVLKHELLHYITYLEYGSADHGPDFKAMAAKYRFPPEIARATHSHHHSTSLQSIEGKIQKLLRLADHTNLHEAQSALLKAEELMTKHNIQVSPSDSNEYVLRRVLRAKRSQPKQKAIASMLKHFDVEVVFHQGKKCTYVELIGYNDSVEVASYVADYLDAKLEALWKESKTTHHLSGARAKNSFFFGVARGYDEQKRPSSKERGLIRSQLKQALQLIYPTTHSTKSGSPQDSNSLSLGKKAGKSLSIHEGVQKKGHPLLSFFNS